MAATRDRPDASNPTRILVDVTRDDGGRLRGSISERTSPPAPFDGVIELVARIEELVDRGDAADPAR